MNVRKRILILIVVCSIFLLAIYLWLWYGFSLTDKNLAQKMSDISLEEKYYSSKSELETFVKYFMEEKIIYDIALDKKKGILINNYSVKYTRDEVKKDVKLLFYWETMHKTGISRVTASIADNSEYKYIEFGGGGSFEVSYGLFYSPKDIEPFKLMRSVYHSEKIERYWYTYRAK